MTTVAQMIEWLKTLPQDAEVECGKEVENGWGFQFKHAPVDIGACDVYSFEPDTDGSNKSRYAGKTVVFIEAN